MDSTVELERGQNVFEIHIDKVRYMLLVVYLFFNFLLYSQGSSSVPHKILQLPTYSTFE